MKQLKSVCSESSAGFKEFYKFVFEYHMLAPGQKTLDKEAAILLIDILMKKSHPISQKFAAFLKQSERKVMNKDQWQHLIALFTLLENKGTYDTSGACKNFDRYN